MNFVQTQEIEAPVPVVFEYLTNFDRFDALARERGAVIHRSDPEGVPGIGTFWQGSFHLRGKQRNFTAEIADFKEPRLIDAFGVSNLFEFDAAMRLRPAGPGRTALRIKVTVTGRTLTGRMLLQSARLAKRRLNRQYRRGLRRLAHRIEADCSARDAAHADA